MIAFESPLERAEVVEGGIVLEVGGAEPMRLLAARVVNSAGLAAPALAVRFAGRDHRQSAQGLLLQGQLLRPRRPLALLAADLPRARARGPGRARHRRPRRALPLRPRHRMGRRDPLSGRPGARRRLLRRGSQILARPPGRCPGPGLLGNPPEARPGRRAGRRLRDLRPRPTTACRAWSSCSASRARASPPPGRSPARWHADWACRSWRTSGDERRHHRRPSGNRYSVCGGDSIAQLGSAPDG